MLVKMRHRVEEPKQTRTQLLAKQVADVMTDPATPQEGRRIYKVVRRHRLGC